MSETEHPWRDESILREKYREEGMTMEELADLWDVSTSTLSKWINRFGIRTGGRGAGDPYKVPIHITEHGYVRVQEESLGTVDRFQLHRLVAVAEYGIEEVAENHVHHKNNIKWDNRPSNLEIIDPEKHGRIHAQESNTPA